MPRIARVIAIGYPHHVTQRGNYRQDIFRSDADRKQYLSVLKEESLHHHLAILAYCLMLNHIHLIVIPKNQDSMSKAFKYTHMRYAQYFNRKMHTTGHLFQGRFFSAVMDELYTEACARYIERNPVRAKLTQKPCLWEWSSAKTHCGIDKHDTLGVNRLFDYIEEKQSSWKSFIDLPDSPDDMKCIKEKTVRGRPLGNDSFIEMLELKLGKALKLQSRGRALSIAKNK